MHRFAILLYHRVAEGDDFFRLRVAPRQFESHMRYLSERCRPMSLEELADAHDAGCVPLRAVAVTFDDGYADNLREAAHTLSAYNMPATFFVTTESLNRPHEHWWDTLTRLLLDEPTLPKVLSLPFDDLREVAAATLDERRTAVREIHNRVRHLSVTERAETMLALAQQIGPSSAPVARPMVAQEVAKLASKPQFEIGAHTTHHLTLPSHASDVQTQELCESKAALETLLRRPVRSVAYPFGEATMATAALAEAAGFLTGVCGDRPSSSGSGRLLLQRIDVTAIEESLPAELERVFCRSGK